MNKETTILFFLNFNFEQAAITQWCQHRKVSLVVIGPEAPLATGLADTLQNGGVACFGPGRVAAQIESDKIWAKKVMDAVRVPTARWQQFSRAEDENGGVACFGPGRVAAQIESDKIWAKKVMDAVRVPTARWQQFSRAEDAAKFIESEEFSGWVIKASGLAAGKGVCVALSKGEALQFVDNLLVEKKFGSAGENIIIEEVLYGVEVSVSW
ncbi:hypothetical protein LSTR_LSTR015763 [Laodelphax striatellus]|uniref:phosphoribosylamine--glycine ligase n=1 Tax=Laodelphax striatellus TaxID=195883 RepID=A0A482WUD6_LAOST|nr:hypothetical protein LSTR_LSTR015763 [Laodelphax striatellus]